MHLNVHVDVETTSAQYIALANLFNELSGVPAASRTQPPADPADLDEPEVVVIPQTTAPAVTRRRRTKAELEAEKAAADAEAKAQEEAIPEQSGVAAAEAAVQNQAPVDEFEKVAATGNKTFTEAEAQQLATVIARTKGPQVVKDKIAELGATRIGDLTADQLNELGNFLEAQK